MGLFGDRHEEHEQAYNTVYNDDDGSEEHKGKLSHEVVSGAAGFFAMRAYEKHLESTGQKPSHEFFKEMAAGVAAGEVDKLAETKGLDMLDREKAKRHATDKAEEMYQARYGN